MTPQDRQLARWVLAQDDVLQGVFDDFVRRVSPLLAKYNYGGKGVWVLNGGVENQLDRELELLGTNLERILTTYQQGAWELAEHKTDALLVAYLAGMALDSKVKESILARKPEALKRFMERKVRGFSPSKRIWKVTAEAKSQLELLLSSGFMEGKSAAELSRVVRHLLLEPDNLFRRIRDREGNLIPSRPMKEFSSPNGGRGVYKSSFMNAFRLTATQTNIAYRTAEHERWANTDFVVGFEISLSGRHPREDICDFMKGRYPKDFKFTGWHPFCICYATAILLPKEEFMEYLEAGNLHKSAIVERHRVREIPARATRYVQDNMQAIDSWKQPPYWVQDNFKDAKISGGLVFR